MTAGVGLAAGWGAGELPQARSIKAPTKNIPTKVLAQPANAASAFRLDIVRLLQHCGEADFDSQNRNPSMPQEIHIHIHLHAGTREEEARPQFKVELPKGSGMNHEEYREVFERLFEEHMRRSYPAS